MKSVLENWKDIKSLSFSSYLFISFHLCLESTLHKHIAVHRRQLRLCEWMNEHIYTHYSLNFSLFTFSLWILHAQSCDPLELACKDWSLIRKVSILCNQKFYFFFLGLAKSTCKSKISRLVDGLSSKSVVFLVNWILGVVVE